MAGLQQTLGTFCLMYSTLLNQNVKEWWPFARNIPPRQISTFVLLFSLAKCEEQKHQSKTSTYFYSSLTERFFVHSSKCDTSDNINQISGRICRVRLLCTYLLVGLIHDLVQSSVFKFKLAKAQVISKFLDFII